MARVVIIKTVINGLTLDGATRDPMQKAVRDALISFMAATARGAQAEATREAHPIRSCIEVVLQPSRGLPVIGARPTMGGGQSPWAVD
jgi:hypothetical protein